MHHSSRAHGFVRVAVASAHPIAPRRVVRRRRPRPRPRLRHRRRSSTSAARSALRALPYEMSTVRRDSASFIEAKVAACVDVVVRGARVASDWSTARHARWQLFVEAAAERRALCGGASELSVPRRLLRPRALFAGDAHCIALRLESRALLALPRAARLRLDSAYVAAVPPRSGDRGGERRDLRRRDALVARRYV